MISDLGAMQTINLFRNLKFDLMKIIIPNELLKPTILQK